MYRVALARRCGAWLGPLLVLALAIAAPGVGEAQISTATVQGKVSDSTGVLPGVTVTAREIASGMSREATTDAEGLYTLAGLRPGTYEIRVTMDQYKPQARTITALVGQTLTVDFSVSPDLTYSETVTVVSERLSDLKTTEVATNVTQEQLQYLPQNTRNFLNMAALAPNMRVSDSDRYKFIYYPGVWDVQELYDLQADPKERVNLIDEPEHQKRAEQMRRRLWDLLEESGGMTVPLRRGSFQANQRKGGR